MSVRTPCSDSLSAVPRHWIAVASAEHALLGRDHQPVGFMQVCHGKAAPLRRLRGGDWVVYYAPAIKMGGRDKLQSFVSLGVVLPGEPYAVDLGGGFVPYRRDVDYVKALTAPIAPLLDQLSFVQSRQHWGSPFRFGLFQITVADMQVIARSMQAEAWLDAHSGSACVAPTDFLPLFN